MFFVKLVGLFNIFDSFKKSYNASFDTLSRKIASCSFEYPKKQLYTCFDGEDGCVNLRFDYDGKEYLFVEYVHKNNKMNNAIKKILKLKYKSNDLYLVLSMIIDQFNSDSKKDKKGEFEYTILPERDKYLKFEKEKYPSIHIFTDDIYYDRTYAGVMMYNRLKRSCL